MERITANGHINWEILADCLRLTHENPEDRTRIDEKAGEA